MHAWTKERLILIDIAFGILILIVGILLIHFLPQQIEYRYSVQIVRDFIFLNLTHIFFTFVLIGIFSPVRESLFAWSKHVSKNEKFGAALVPIVILSFLFFSAAKFKANNSVEDTLKYLVVPIAFLFPYFHNVRQHYGLMRFYFPDHHRPLLHYGHYIMMALYIAYRVIISKGQMFHDAKELPLSNEHLRILEFIFFISMFIVAFCISLEALYRAKEKKFHQFLYSLRFFIYPIAPLSFYGAYLLGMVHGIEYALFLIPVMAKHKKFRFSWGSALAILALTTIVALLLTHHAAHYPANSVAPIYIQFIASVHFTFLYMHYLIDSLLFRFNRPENAAFTMLLKH